MHRQFIGPGAEKVSTDADEVSKIEQLIELKTFFSDKVELHVNLQPPSRLLKMSKTGFPLSAYRHQPSRDAHINAIAVQLLGSRIRIFGDNLGNGMGRHELARVAL